MQPQRHYLKDNESLESAIYTQMTLNRRHSASAKSFEYRPDFDNSIKSLKATSPRLHKHKERLLSGDKKDPENCRKRCEIDINHAPFNMAQSFKKLQPNVNINDEGSSVTHRRPSSSGGPRKGLTYGPITSSIDDRKAKRRTYQTSITTSNVMRPLVGDHLIQDALPNGQSNQTKPHKNGSNSSLNHQNGSSQINSFKERQRKTNISKSGPNDEKKNFLTKKAALKSNDQETFHNFTNSLNLNCVTSSYGGKSNSYLEEKTKMERKLSKNKVDEEMNGRYSNAQKSSQLKGSIFMELDKGEKSVKQHQEWDNDKQTIDHLAVMDVKDVEEDLNGEFDTGPMISMTAKNNHFSKNRKRVEVNSKAISQDVAISLKELTLGSANQSFPAGWVDQCFAFQAPSSENDKNDSTGCSFGLVQYKGGPCGVLAVVQAYIIKHHLFRRNVREETHCTASAKLVDWKQEIQMTVQEQRLSLSLSLSNILSLSQPNKGGINPFKVALPGSTSHILGTVGHFKCDGLTERLMVYEINDVESLQEFILQNIDFYLSNMNSAAMALLYSVILTKGIETVKNEMDGENVPLIGAHGYCSQEMVNLLLTGRAVSNTFDGHITLSESGISRASDENNTIEKCGNGETLLKGIEHQSDIGLLSLFEHYKSIVVGKNLKCPKYPIWIVCSESHFTTLFGYQIDSTKVQSNDMTHFNDPIELVYYDQLANQIDPIFLTIRKQESWDLSSMMNDSKELISPIEHCIKTQWSDSIVDWNGSEPLL